MRTFFGGCARSVGVHLKWLLPQLDRLRTEFTDKSFTCIVEDNSSDNTKDLLQKWASTQSSSSHSIHLVLNFENSDRSRPKRIAKAFWKL